jgi:hypothetical protein
VVGEHDEDGEDPEVAPAMHMSAPSGYVARPRPEQEPCLSSQGRGSAEEAADVPETAEEHNEPASPSTTPGGEDSRADGHAEETAGKD